jgi:hypothetical protein
MLWLLRHWGLLSLSTFGDEVRKDLGLDGLSWTELKFELS